MPTTQSKYLRGTLNLILISIAILALMHPAIINGFPLVYSDSGTYIASAKSGTIPVDRPMVYSIFLNLTSLDVSLWITLIFQSVILVYLMYLLLNNVFGISYSLQWTTGMLIILSFSTGVSNYTSQLMPDIFAGWMILSLSILLFGKGIRITTKIWLWVIFVVSVTSHFSVLLSATLLILLLISYNLFREKLNTKTNYLLLILTVVSWLTIPVINKYYGGKFAVSRCKNVSLMARLVETGIVGEYLNEYCAAENYSLCQFRDSLPSFGYMFAWEPASPLYQGECLDKSWDNCWIEKDKEYGELIRDIVLSPKYVAKLISVSLRDTYRQLIDFKIGVLVPMKEQSAPYSTIEIYYPQHLEAYRHADQFGRILYFTTIGQIQKWLVIISFMGLWVILIFFRRLFPYKKLLYFAGVVIAGVTVNAAVCSSFSTVVDRYQARVVWLLPLLFLVFLVVKVTAKKEI